MSRAGIAVTPLSGSCRGLAVLAQAGGEAHVGGVESVREIAAIVLKAVVGGLFVVGFAVVAEAVRPKRLAGVFAAAPSVALGSLMVTVLFKGDHDAMDAARGMAAGAVAFTAYCLVGIGALREMGALRGSAAALTVWFAVAAAVAFAAAPRP